jgi:hypothetical protein
MSGQDNFVSRWSRLKRESAEREKEARGGTGAPQTPDRDHRAVDAGRTAETPGDARAADAGSEVPFDPATLPPIESIVAGSDVRAFLQKGVPAELATAALRLAWATDPAIRDFIGIAENQWDFTAPTTIPGFGPIEATDDLRRLVAQALGEISDAASPEADRTEEHSRTISRAEPTAARDPSDQGASTPPEEQGSEDQTAADVAAARDPQSADATPRAAAGVRRHGGALPR